MRGQFTCKLVSEPPGAGRQGLPRPRWTLNPIPRRGNTHDLLHPGRCRTPGAGHPALHGSERGMSALTVRFLVGLVIGFVLATVAATPLALLLRWLGVGL